MALGAGRGRLVRQMLTESLLYGALGAGKWDGILVVGEVALSVTLVIGTALRLRSLSALLQVDPGFDPNHVLTAEMALSSRGTRAIRGAGACYLPARRAARIDPMSVLKLE